MSPLAKRVAKLEQRRNNSVADAGAMFELGRSCYFEGRPLPAGLTPGEHDLAAAVVDQLTRFYAVGPGPSPLEGLPS